MTFVNTLRGLICLLPLTLQAAPPEGQAEYEMNCKACHLIDTTLVGPSLIEISRIYPGDKLADFLKWTKTPGKKNPQMIQMPSMAHLPDESLAKIHRYLLKVTKGKKERKGRPLPTPSKKALRHLPYVMRGFLPETSPASIAVVMPGDLSVCWDAEACRLRYAWKGHKTNFNSIYGPSKLGAKPFYRETAEILWTSADEAKPKFLGYRLISGYPEFHYRIGNREIRELVFNGPTPGSIARKFIITGPPDTITLDLTHEGEMTLTSDQGTLKDNKLTLTGVSSFTLHLTQK